MARILERAYASYNRRYFNRLLPPVPVLWSRKLPSDCCGWYTPEGSEHGAILITESLKTSPSLWRMTLLHEMCHVRWREHPEELRSNVHKHSCVWVKEMRRLANAGAFDKIW